MQKSFFANFFTASAVTIALTGLTLADKAHAMALTPGSPACSAMPTQGTTYINCAGSFAGNNIGSAATEQDTQDTLNAFFGAPSGGWVNQGTTNAGATEGPFNTFTGATTGTLTFEAAMSGYYAIVLKAANRWSAYRIFVNSPGTVNFAFNTIGTAVNNNDVAQDLSHATLYKAVPTPALLPGLIGIGVAAVRKRKQEAEAEA